LWQLPGSFFSGKKRSTLSWKSPGFVVKKFAFSNQISTHCQFFDRPPLSAVTLKKFPDGHDDKFEFLIIKKSGKVSENSDMQANMRIKVWLANRHDRHDRHCLTGYSSYLQTC
jgi:hypothetical protein